MLKRYQARKEDVTAIQLDRDNIVEIAEWCDGRPYTNTRPWTVVFEINNGSNLSIACEGDYIVEDHEGEFSRMKAHQFETIYKEKE